MRTMLLGVLMLSVCLLAHGGSINSITIDGDFSDWVGLPSYMDPVDDQHDTDHDQPGDTPAYVDHEDVDLLEFKFTHDANNLYAYFRATGEIGRTQTSGAGTAGRYYVIVTIDVDNNDTTGYWLNEGGYYPTSAGYDMNMEVEYYDGAFNTGHYLNHGCLDAAGYAAAQVDQANGVVDVLPGTYDWYTQWVWWDTPQGNPGEITLPDGHSTIMWVVDKGPVYQGILTIALSGDGHEAEMMAPFRGFMDDKTPPNDPIMALGRTIDISFSLEASGELAVGGQWASDTADPIEDYYLSTLLAGDDDDSDGLTNGEEDVLGTLPLNPDTDGDDLPDGWEVDYGLSPTSDVGDDGRDGDPDGDNFTNYEEYLAGSEPNNGDSYPMPTSGPCGVAAMALAITIVAYRRLRWARCSA